MKPEKEIDGNLDFIFAELSLEGIDPDYTLSKKRVRHLIREVAEEVIGEYEDSGKIEWHGEEDARIDGRDDLRSEQRTKLNNILGKEK